MPPQPVELFYSYSHKDEGLRDELENHLALLRREGTIKGWHDRRITAGREWEGDIDEHLNAAGVILLLISSDFLASDYCYDIEVKRAMERHEAKDARVIPVILRPCDWMSAPFGKIESLPKDVVPVTKWANRDEAFLDVAKGIRKAVGEISASKQSNPPAPPAQTVSVPPALQIPNNLIVDFVPRRDREDRDIVERLTKELTPQENRLIVLWGAGGVGKTTLAAEAVRALVEAYAQCILWIDAEKRTDFVFGTLLDEIATQLGRADLRPLALTQKQEEVSVLTASAPTLIVLDNFETIIEEEQARCAEWLKHCSALIITREGVEGVFNIPVDPMSLAEARTLVDKLISQARDQSAFAGLDRDRVISTAEFNPLVLQWIIAQIDLAQDPDEVLNELARGEGTAAQRVFNRSFDLPQLAEGGRAVLLALSLFVPSASRPMLAEIAGMNLSKDKDKKRFKDATKRLSSLWLVRVDGNRLTVEGLTREFAKARLSADPRAKIFRPRFVDRFLRYAEANAKMNAGDFNALEAEKDNILNAIDVAFEMKEWKKVMRTRYALEDFLDVHGYWDEAIRRGEQAREAALQAEDEGSVAQFTGNIARIRSNRGEYDEARQVHRQTLGVFRKLGYKASIAAALVNIASTALNRGDWVEARQHLNESLEIYKSLGNQHGVALTLHNLGTLAVEQGEFLEAQRLFDDSFKIHKELGNQDGIATNLQVFGELAEIKGDLESAQQLYNESLEFKIKLGDQSGIARNLMDLGGIAQVQGDLVEARQLYNESLKINKRLGAQLSIAANLYGLGYLEFVQGDLIQARQLFNECLEIARKLNYQKAIISYLQSLGQLAQEQGDFAEARRLYNESLEFSKDLYSKGRIAGSLHYLAWLAQDQEDFAEARQLYDESLEINNKLGNQTGIAGDSHQLGTLSLIEGNLPEAENLLQQSLAILQKLGHKQYIAECLESIGNLRVAQGRLPEAAGFFDESLEIAKALPQPLRIGSVHHSRGLLAEKQGDVAEAGRLFRDALVVFEKLGSPKAEKVRRDLARVEGKAA